MNHETEYLGSYAGFSRQAIYHLLPIFFILKWDGWNWQSLHPCLNLKFWVAFWILLCHQQCILRALPITHENVNVWVNRYFGVSFKKPRSTYCMLILACGQARAGPCQAFHYESCWNEGPREAVWVSCLEWRGPVQVPWHRRPYRRRGEGRPRSGSRYDKKNH